MITAYIKNHLYGFVNNLGNLDKYKRRFKMSKKFIIIFQSPKLLQKISFKKHSVSKL